MDKLLIDYEGTKFELLGVAAKAVQAIFAENEALKAELSTLSEIAHKWDAFEAGCNEAMKDAERYRKWKTFEALTAMTIVSYVPDKWDSLIDAAMEK